MRDGSLEEFVKLIRDSPWDHHQRLIFADWLEENGYEKQAQGQREIARHAETLGMLLEVREGNSLRYDLNALANRCRHLIPNAACNCSNCAVWFVSAHIEVFDTNLWIELGVWQ